MFCGESKEIRIASSDAAGAVHLKRLIFLSGREADLSGKVDVSGRQKSAVDDPVGGTLTDHHGVPVIGADVMNGLSLPDQRGEELVEVFNFLLA